MNVSMRTLWETLRPRIMGLSTVRDGPDLTAFGAGYFQKAFGGQFAVENAQSRSPVAFRLSEWKSRST
jgi:hypothetical protein